VVASGLYLDVSGDSGWAGTAIDTWYYNGNDNQYFGTI
jgi:Ricin-type beta-trefoil lectin domain-like